jgi:TorA maturation chaperone TorD
MLPLLSSLWLTEPDAAPITRAVELGFPLAPAGDLAAAYTDLFLLNLPPYGTVFTDPLAELNGPAAGLWASRYAAYGYQPSALADAAAPDHLGLILGFLDHLEGQGAHAASAAAHTVAEALAWAPALCIAVQQEPAAHAFYQALAGHTLAALLDRFNALAPDLPDPLPTLPPPDPGPLPDPEGELRLRDLARFFLAPARCGLFLSRTRLGRLARDLGLPLPFGPRLDLAEALLQAAGANDQLPALLAALDDLSARHAAAHAALSTAHPLYAPLAHPWLARLTLSRHQLSLMLSALP